MKALLAAASGALMLAIAMPAAAANNIDTTSSYTGDIIYWAGTPVYGQTFDTGGSNANLQSFSLYVSHGSGEGPRYLRGFVGTWDGSTNEMTSLLFLSDETSVSPGGTQEIAFSTGGIAMTSGQQYVAGIATSDGSISTSGGYSMPFGADSIAGKFVYAGSDMETWYVNHVGENDVWFKASFAAVPEPATWAMMIGGFGAVGATLRRRKLALA